jgi:hypothetical protein
LAKLFEAKLSVSSSQLAIRAPQNWIVGAMISTMAQDLETITTAKTQALDRSSPPKALQSRCRRS